MNGSEMLTKELPVGNVVELREQPPSRAPSIDIPPDPRAIMERSLMLVHKDFQPIEIHSESKAVEISESAVPEKDFEPILTTPQPRVSVDLVKAKEDKLEIRDESSEETRKSTEEDAELPLKDSISKGLEEEGSDADDGDRIIGAIPKAEEKWVNEDNGKLRPTSHPLKITKDDPTTTMTTTMATAAAISPTGLQEVEKSTSTTSKPVLMSAPTDALDGPTISWDKNATEPKTTTSTISATTTEPLTTSITALHASPTSTAEVMQEDRIEWLWLLALLKCLPDYPQSSQDTKESNSFWDKVFMGFKCSFRDCENAIQNQGRMPPKILTEGGIMRRVRHSWAADGCRCDWVNIVDHFR